MWVLPARGDPAKLSRFFEMTRLTAPLVVVNDANDLFLDGYDALTLPESAFRLVQPGGGTGTGDAYRFAYSTLGTQPYWGMMTDDANPDADGWDEGLPEVARSWGVSFPADQPAVCHYGFFPCIGGALVDAVGYLAHPDQMHRGIDNFWNHLARALGTLRPAPQYVIRRGHEVDKPGYEADRDAWKSLRFGPRWQAIVDGVKTQWFGTAA